MAKEKKDTVPDNINPMNFPHYIFFSTLKDDDFDTYNNAYNYFQGLVNKIKGVGEQDADKAFEKENATIVDLIRQLEQVASIERENEIAFLKAQKDVIEKNIKNGDEDLQEDMQGVLDLMNNNKSWDYKKIITLFNKMRINQSVYNQNLLDFYNYLVQQTTNMKTSLDQQVTYTKKVTIDGKKVDQQVTDTLRHLYLTKYSVFINQIKQYYSDTFNGLPDRINQLYQDTLNLILNDEQFLQKNIIATLQTRTTNTTGAIQDLIANEILQYPNMDAESIKKQIFNNYITKINAIDLNKFQLERVSSSDMRSLEEIALTTGQGLADFVLNLSTKNQIKILQDLKVNLPKSYNTKKGTPSYAKKSYEKYLKTIKEKQTTQSKAELSKRIKEAIFTRIKENIANSDELLKRIPQELKDKSTKTLNQILKSYTAQGFFLTKKDIISTLKTTQIGPKNFAELISSQEFTSVMKKNFNSLLEGKKIQLKNDIVFTFSTSSLDLKKENISQDAQKMAQDLQEQVENFMQIFMEQYREAGKGKTNVEAAYKVWEENMQKLSDLYNDLLKQVDQDQEQQKQIQQFLSNSFFGGISVKEYNNYQNELGYHGGALGANDAPEKVLNNIYKMYELGGLTPIETKLMMQAVLNCAHQTIAREVGIVDVVQDYLIGGAAMMMFDEGFSTLPNLQEWIKKELFGGFAPKQVHLYQFNTLYIPASYVLQDICNNLKKVYNNLIQEETTAIETYSTSTSTQVYIENPITPSSVDMTKEVEDRWSSVSELAKAQTKIHIMLMAGILDIFQQIPELINDSIR